MTDRVAGQQVDETEDLKLALKKVTEVIQGRPTARDDLLAILGAHLDGKPQPDTWVNLSQAILAYFQPEGGNALLWVLQSPSERVPMADGVATKEVAYLLDSAVALYGSRLENAYQADGQMPDDWALITRQIISYRGENRVTLRFDITKYNGDVTSLECSPNSAANLCRWFITYLGSYVGDGFYVDDTITGLRQAVSAFEATLKQTEGGWIQGGTSLDGEATEPSKT